MAKWFMIKPGTYSSSVLVQILAWPASLLGSSVSPNINLKHSTAGSLPAAGLSSQKSVKQVSHEIESVTFDQVFFFGKPEKGKKKNARYTYFMSSLPPLHCLPVNSDFILCHAINVSQLNFTVNLCGLLEEV